MTGNEGVEDFSFGIVTDKKKEKKMMLPTHNCNLTCKKKKRKKKASIRNRKDSDVKDRSLSKTERTSGSFSIVR